MRLLTRWDSSGGAVLLLVALAISGGSCTEDAKKESLGCTEWATGKKAIIAMGITDDESQLLIVDAKFNAITVNLSKFYSNQDIPVLDLNGTESSPMTPTGMDEKSNGNGFFIANNRSMNGKGNLAYLKLEGQKLTLILKPIKTAFTTHDQKSDDTTKPDSPMVILAGYDSVFSRKVVADKDNAVQLSKYTIKFDTSATPPTFSFAPSTDSFPDMTVEAGTDFDCGFVDKSNVVFGIDNTAKVVHVIKSKHSKVNFTKFFCPSPMDIDSGIDWLLYGGIGGGVLIVVLIIVCIVICIINKGNRIAKKSLVKRKGGKSSKSKSGSEKKAKSSQKPSSSTGSKKDSKQDTTPSRSSAPSATGSSGPASKKGSQRVASSKT